MNAPDPAGELTSRQGGTLRDYLHVLRRRKWVVLQALVLIPAAAVALSTRQPARYAAKAQVLLTNQSFAELLTNTQDQSQTPQLADRVASTQAQLARVPTVVNRALSAVPHSGLSYTRFLSNSSVSAAVGADILTFSVQAGSPRLAVRLTTAYAQAYTSYRHQLDTASLQRARTDVGTRIAQLRASGQSNSALASKLVETQQQLQTLETLQTSNASVVKDALRAPQVAPAPIRDGVIGAALGLLVGIALALLIDALDTRVRSGEEVAERLGLPLLGRVPEPPRRIREHFGLVMIEEPTGRHAEAFRMLRTNLELANIEREAAVIAISSALPAEGKSTTVANLAVAVARSGRRVTLVDLDLRKPMLSNFFVGDTPWGVTDVALGRVTLDRALRQVNVASFVDEDDLEQDRGPQRLDVLVAGRVPPNPGEFVSSRRLAAILSELRSRYDLVLVDTPPILSVGDALALSAYVDAFVLVSNLSLSRRGELQELRRTLGFARCEILGTVLTAPGASGSYGNRDAYYGYGYGSHAVESASAVVKPTTLSR